MGVSNALSLDSLFFLIAKLCQSLSCTDIQVNRFLFLFNPTPLYPPSMDGYCIKLWQDLLSAVKICALQTNYVFTMFLKESNFHNLHRLFLRTWFPNVRTKLAMCAPLARDLCPGSAQERFPGNAGCVFVDRFLCIVFQFGFSAALSTCITNCYYQ